MLKFSLKCLFHFLYNPSFSALQPTVKAGFSSPTDKLDTAVNYENKEDEGKGKMNDKIFLILLISWLNKFNLKYKIYTI